MTTVEVHLRPIIDTNRDECSGLTVAENQLNLVAPNAKSMEQAQENKSLYPMGIYDVAARGHEKPLLPMIGFTMYELVAGVGFIERLMIDEKYQGKGYGKAAMLEVIRRLRLYPEVEMIATSYKSGNDIACKLYKNLGFVHWGIDFDHPSDEVFVKLP